MNERIKEHYLLRFKLNERDYSPDQAKKKNADITICYSKSDIEDNKFF